MHHLPVPVWDYHISTKILNFIYQLSRIGMLEGNKTPKTDFPAIYKFIKKIYRSDFLYCCLTENIHSSKLYKNDILPPKLQVDSHNFERTFQALRMKPTDSLLRDPSHNTAGVFFVPLLFWGWVLRSQTSFLGA